MLLLGSLFLFFFRLLSTFLRALRLSCLDFFLHCGLVLGEILGVKNWVASLDLDRD